MEAVFTPQFFTQFGMVGGLLWIAIKALQKIYNHMREDNLRREEASCKRESILMEHLEKVTDTLSNVDKTLGNIDRRLVILESCAAVTPKQDSEEGDV